MIDLRFKIKKHISDALIYKDNEDKLFDKIMDEIDKSYAHDIKEIRDKINLYL